MKQAVKKVAKKVTKRKVRNVSPKIDSRKLSKNTVPSKVRNWSANLENIKPYLQTGMSVFESIKLYNDTIGKTTKNSNKKVISYEAFIKYKNEHPHLKELITFAKGHGIRTAKQLVQETIEAGDVNTAKWLLERRDNDYVDKKQNLNVNATIGTDKARQIRDQLYDKIPNNKTSD